MRMDRLTLENIFLNSDLIQQTIQTWEASTRSLQIGDHTREFIYQNNRLAQVSTPQMDLSYFYDLSGSLKHKSTPFSTTTIDYHPSGLPENIHTQLPDQAYREALEWYLSGKLAAYSAPTVSKQLTYTERGYLQSDGAEKYDFDFGTPGTGVRTAAPGWTIRQEGLDPFGKITTETSDKDSITTLYNPMGEVISQNERQFEWDPWGRLLRITDDTLSWEASYDALGRRLQTRQTSGRSSTLTTTSFYDPETEFREIGVKYGGKTFWKIYGPDSCDAVIDETGASVVLMHNAMDQLAAVISQQGTVYSEQLPSSYGPQSSAPSVPSDLLSYAQSLTWHSQAQDPTGLIWMGARYYDPQGGRFLSPDPIGYPACMDLYAYAGGDPINYLDPDGRFASPVYQMIKPVLISAIQPFNIINQATQGFNMIPAYLANHGLTRSGFFQAGSFDLPQGGIGWINGINNTSAQTRASAQQLSQYAGGARVYGINNATNWDSIQIASTAMDILECGLGGRGIHTPPVQLLKNQWNHFIATHKPWEKFLQICHSGGALHVKNALMTSPESVRQRIIVLAIAPAAIVPKKLCFQSYNYISRRDFVTHLDVKGKLKYGNQLQILEPHPDANFWDHELLSPTFKDTIDRHINDYIENYGRIK